jgi:HEAT repeat protein
VPALERALEDREAEVRQGAALAIGAIDPTNSRYQQSLIDAMRAANGPAMLEVGKMGHGAAWAVPTLIPLLSHESAKVRALSARTLGQIGPVAERATPALKRALGDPHDAVKDAARDALEKIQGPSSSPPR